jgi:hypothetical protein
MILAALVVAVIISPARDARADAFDLYEAATPFDLPAGAGPFDALGDGRLITLVGDELFAETGVGARSFGSIGRLEGGDFSDFGPAFVEVSPDGTRVAIGNGGGAGFDHYQVGVFDLRDLGGDWFDANHFSAAWFDDRSLALTAGVFGSPAFVTMLDVVSDPHDPTNPLLIDGVGGASGGIAFDQEGRLFTGNGFAIEGPSATGTLKAFDAKDWMAAWRGGDAVDFETSGSRIAELLSAGTLGFDGEGHLHVGGGDFDEGDFDYGALIRASAVADALGGRGPVDRDDPDRVRRFDPDGANDFNFYSLGYNPVTGELYLREGTRVYPFVVPEPASGLLMLIAAMLLFRRRNPSVPGLGCHGQALLVRARRFVVCERKWDRICATGLLIGCSMTTPVGAGKGSSFATRVIDFNPAPGQFVNVEAFNDPDRALGAPIGGGTGDGNDISVVSLGGFGGTLTLAFDHTVEDHPLSPMGLDAIGFGNAFWVGGSEERHWGECATIEISLDENENGLADDPWYLIPGSHIVDRDAQWSVQRWDDDVSDDTYPPALASWIPPGRRGVWDTVGYRLPDDPFHGPVVRNPLEGTGEEGVFGYADYTPTLLLGDLDADNVIDDPDITPEAFYTRPDDPHRVGITPGAGGGDAFDIARAIDPQTGQPANLPGFTFIRITNGVHAVNGPFGEVSPEIDAVADATIDPIGDFDGDEDIDLADWAALQACFDGPAPPEGACSRLDRDADGWIDLLDHEALAARMTGPTERTP